VGIGSLYRRYGSKGDLLRTLCLLAMRQSIAAAEQALDETGDPWAGLTGFIRAEVAQGTGSLAPLAGAIETTPEMWATSRHGRDLLGELVDRARAAGALRADVTPLDIAHLIEMFGRLGPVHADSAEHAIRLRLLAIAIDGLRAGRPADPLPGPSPTTAHYEGRWVPRGG
jgi:AcrR family transcriptional regulator